jgi:hypothetical protein
MRFLFPAVLLLCACPAPSGPDAGADAGVDAGVAVDAGPGDAGADAGVAGVELMTRLAGLWVGPARMTPLGDFPLMSMDFRPVGPGFLFAQADLDVADNLRFGISIETYGGADVLAYRNGGFFQGVLRDSRTKLVESDDAAGRYRFCSVPQGCAYLDATFTFSGPNDLVFDTKVRGTQHVLWTAQRRETRTVPAPFPATAGSLGDGTAPWPAMATVQTTVRWVSPLTQAGTVWVLLTTTNCAPTFTCVASRSLRVEAAAGATSATLPLPAVHAGDYRLTAVVDRTRMFGTRLAPTSGDSLAVDQPVTVPASGQVSPDVLAAYTLP